MVAVGDLDVDVCAGGVASRVRQRLLDDAVGGQIDAQREAGDRPFAYEADRCSGRLCLLDQVVELVESGLRCPVGSACGVLAQDSEQPAGLGQRLPCGGCDRLEPAGRVRGELGEVSRAASLSTVITDRWCATMSWSSRAMRARSSITVRARVLSAIASSVASRAATASSRLRSDSPTARAAAETAAEPYCQDRVVARKPRQGDDDEGDEQWAREEEAATDHKPGKQEEHDVRGQRWSAGTLVPAMRAVVAALQRPRRPSAIAAPGSARPTAALERTRCSSRDRALNCWCWRRRRRPA